jgi:DNA replication protein DnaC
MSHEFLLFFIVFYKKFPFQPTYKQDIFSKNRFFFNRNDNEPFCFKGYAGTGKTTVISTIVNNLLDINKNMFCWRQPVVPQK